MPVSLFLDLAGADLGRQPRRWRLPRRQCGRAQRRTPQHCRHASPATAHLSAAQTSRGFDVRPARPGGHPGSSSAARRAGVLDTEAHPPHRRSRIAVLWGSASREAAARCRRASAGASRPGAAVDQASPWRWAKGRIYHERLLSAVTRRRRRGRRPAAVVARRNAGP